MRSLVGIAAIAVLAAVTAFSSGAEFEPAAAEDYFIFIPMCWEPDIDNTSGETKVFRVHAQFGNGRTSDTQTTGPIPHGGRIHLHLFKEAWEFNMLEELAALDEVHGCRLIVETQVSD